MKIDSEQILATTDKFRKDAVGKNDSVEKGDTAKGAGKKSRGQGSDRVDLSSGSGEIERLKKTLQEIPDLRSDKVARLKEQVDAGTYRVGGAEVAKKMLQSWREIHDK